MSETYYDERYCDNCEKDTIHECYDSGHERDSSNDRETCEVCGYYRIGISGRTQHPPA